jgi:hypothetical protein
MGLRLKRIAALNTVFGTLLLGWFRQQRTTDFFAGERCAIAPFVERTA